MNRLLRHIPLSLIFARILIAVVIVILSVVSEDRVSRIIFYLIIAGFISDFLDGYIARLLQTSTTFLRRFDTVTDRFFWVSILFAAWYLHPDFFKTKITGIILVLSLEAVNYVISFARFRREISTHAILSKFWAVSLLLAFCDVILHGDSAYLFDVALVLGVISRIDTGLIMLILPGWDHDIPTFYHAFMIRKGKKIRKMNIFNG